MLINSELTKNVSDNVGVVKILKEALEDKDNKQSLGNTIQI